MMEQLQAYRRETVHAITGLVVELHYHGGWPHDLSLAEAVRVGHARDRAVTVSGPHRGDVSIAPPRIAPDATPAQRLAYFAVAILNTGVVAALREDRMQRTPDPPPGIPSSPVRRLPPVRIRLLLVDARMCRELLCLAFVLHADLVVLGQADDPGEAASMVARLKPDVVVIGPGRTVAPGSIARLRASHRATRIVLIADFDGDHHVQQFVRAGVHGFLPKAAPPAELLLAIRAVARGFMHLGIRGAMRNEESRQARVSPVPPVDVLGARERQVLELLARGARSAHIAARLRIAPATVEAHRRNIMRKLDLHNIAELTHYAIREGVVPLSTYE